MRLIDADKSDEIIVFDKQNELLQCSVVRDYCERQREFLNKFPTIDAVPVVRCKECKYSYRIDDSYRVCKKYHYQKLHDESPKNDVADYWFCADGERKGGDE